MSRTAPDVLDGMRAPRSVRLEQIKAASEAASALPNPKSTPDFNIYVSKFRRYRVQTMATRGYIDPGTGRKIEGTTISALFDEGVYRNNHRDPKVRAQIDESLQSNPYFGKFGSAAHFWLASDQNAKMEDMRIKSALDTLKSMPREAVEKFVADLHQGSAEDHELPPPAASEPSSGVRPIPSR